MGQAWCDACGGRGTRGPSHQRCGDCAGTGLLACPTRCPTCQGRGEVLAPLQQAVAEMAREADEFPPATAILLTLTFLSFAIEGVAPGYRYRFWLYGRQALDGQWWQFVTSIFLHTNLLQLGFNTAALWIFGPPLERVIGGWRFAALYLGSGVVGNALSVALNPSIQTVGASGALFGIGGAWLGLQLRHRYFSWRVVGLLSGYIALMLAFGFAADTGLNNQAHLGGFVFGLLTGLAMGGRPRA